MYPRSDLFWYGAYLKDTDLDMLSERKCFYNRFPKVQKVVNKASFSNIMKPFQKLFPQDYGFNPLTFVLPEDDEKLRSYFGKN